MLTAFAQAPKTDLKMISYCPQDSGNIRKHSKAYEIRQKFNNLEGLEDFWKTNQGSGVRGQDSPFV